MLRKTTAVLVAMSVTLVAGIGAIGPSVATAADQNFAKTGQQLINEGRYERAIREFTKLINAQPTNVEGYRGRIEAELLLGRYSDAVRDYARVTALNDPDAADTILAGYAARLATNPIDVPTLTGASFARWWYFDYASAIHLLNRLLSVRPNDLYGNLFRGSSRLLHGANKDRGVVDLEFAIFLAPGSADVRYIVADAYTYGLSDPERAFAEASLALNWGLDTPRIHAILASAYLAFGDQSEAAAEILEHIELVTAQLLPTAPLAAGGSLSLDLVPGRTYSIPVAATVGESLSILTTSRDFFDSICVLLAPDGTPVVGGDDYLSYFAGFDWVAEETGTYTLLVTSFESVSTGKLKVTRE